MCGIAGIIHLDGSPASQTLLHAMTDVIAHRGPDGEGHFVEGPVALGHRRLAIIDLTSAARQPMASNDGRFVIAYNGEIYNFRELRVLLAARGYSFVSQSDTEVLLHAMAEWGEAALDRLNGMFAFALWDRRNETLLLVRDRYGIKPLYWGIFGKTLLFGSEIKAILAHAEARAEIDKEGLLEYFTFQNFFTDHTLFKGIQLMPAGTLMRVRVPGDRPKYQRYWDFRFNEPERTHSDTEYLEELDRLFQQAVNRQLVSDVDVGAYLSGGMDSGSITALSAKQLPYIRTFTCGFDLNSASGVELSFDERSVAEYMSYKFRTEHYEMVLKAGDMERVMPQIAWHLEEPRVGQSYPNYYIAQLASKFVKVVLSGTGGDELFGGYPWRYYRAAASDSFAHYVANYFEFWQRLVPNGLLQNVFSPIWNDVKDIEPRLIFERVFQAHDTRLEKPEDYVNHSLYFECKTFLHGLLVVEDKLSMAHSLETRVPFLDNDLVDFAMRVPVRLKLRNLTNNVRINENEVGDKTVKYYQRTSDGKLLLREMMRRHIPDAVAEREKQGFSAPDASWFKGESIEYVRRKILDKNARIYDLMDREVVQSLVNDHLEGRTNRRLLIWSLLNVESMLERYFSAPQNAPGTPSVAVRARTLSA